MSGTNHYGADSITVLEGLEAVRKRPGMYIGSLSKKGLNHLVYEIVDNSVDEHLAGFCTHISVILERDGSAVVYDNGRGVPVELHEKGVSAERLVFSTLHAGGKFGTGVYKTSGGLHGVGSSVVNALSEYMEVRISRNGKEYYDRYERGVPTVELNKGLLPITKETKKTGTYVKFMPDSQIFDNIDFGANEIMNRLHEIAYLNPNLHISFEDRRGEGSQRIIYHESEGIKGFVSEMTSDMEKLSSVIVLNGEYDGIEVDVALQYTDDFHEEIIGFCNTIFNGEGGTHITGFKTALTNIINSYARSFNVLKEKEPNFTGADIRTGITAVVAVKHPEPRFEGQTKTKLDNQDAVGAVAKLLGEKLVLYLDRNPDELKAIIENAQKAARLRKSQSKSMSNALAKKKFAFDTNGKLANCESKDSSQCEIFIVEGDSAGGSARSARERKYQAILPIRGKILNVEKATMDKVLANEEIKSMIHAFGCGFSEGYGNDFDISKLKYNKIIIMADADIDGAHISTLLLTLFYRFMPQLISDGHVYKAMPPLYKVTNSKKEEVYLYDDRQLEKYKKKHTGKLNLQRYKGLGEMDPEQLWETTLNPKTRTLMKIEIEDARLASHMTELLMGNNVANRREFIYNNAKLAQIDT